jgi:hypothetical protein
MTRSSHFARPSSSLLIQPDADASAFRASAERYDGCLDGTCVSHRDEGAAQPGSRPSQPQYHCPDGTAQQLRDLVIRKLLEFAQENDFSEVEGQLSDCRLCVVSILPAHENLTREGLAVPSNAWIAVGTRTRSNGQGSAEK